CCRRGSGATRAHHDAIATESPRQIMSIKTKTQRAGFWLCGMARTALLAAGLVAALSAPQAALAQFSMVPAPVAQHAPRASAAEAEKDYRVDAARHLYAAYPLRIYRGKMPPMLYSVMVVETEIDTAG